MTRASPAMPFADALGSFDAASATRPRRTSEKSRLRTHQPSRRVPRPETIAAPFRRRWIVRVDRAEARASKSRTNRTIRAHDVNKARCCTRGSCGELSSSPSRMPHPRATHSRQTHARAPALSVTARQNPRDTTPHPHRCHLRGILRNNKAQCRSLDSRDVLVSPLS